MVVWHPQGGEAARMAAGDPVQHGHVRRLPLLQPAGLHGLHHRHQPLQLPDHPRGQRLLPCRHRVQQQPDEVTR